MFSNSTSMFAVGVRVNSFTAVFPSDSQPTMSEAIKMHSAVVDRIRSTGRDVTLAGIYHLKTYEMEDFLANWRKYMVEGCWLVIGATKNGKSFLVPNALAGEVFTIGGGEDGGKQLRDTLNEISSTISGVAWQISVATPANSMAKGNSPIHKIVEEAKARVAPTAPTQVAPDSGAQNMARQFKAIADDFADRGLSDAELAKELERRMPGGKVLVVEDADEMREFLEKHIAGMTGLSGDELKAAVDEAVSAVSNHKGGDVGAIAIKIPVKTQSRAPAELNEMKALLGDISGDEPELKAPSEYTLAEISAMPNRGLMRLFSLVEPPVQINYKEASSIQEHISAYQSSEVKYVVTSEFPCGCEVVHPISAYFSTLLPQDMASMLLDFCQKHYPVLQHRIYRVLNRESMHDSNGQHLVDELRYFPMEDGGFNMAINGDHSGMPASFPHTVLEHETEVPAEFKSNYKLFSLWKMGTPPTA